VNDDTGAPEQVAAAPADLDAADLERIAGELDAVAAALDRLDDGTYWTDEVTGGPLDDALLATDPTRRRAG
jgi:hypothetical protein